MGIKILISNRQSGKSKTALYEFLKEPTKSLLIVPKKQVFKKDFIRKYSNIQSQEQSLENLISGSKIDKIIIDEYLFYSIENQHRIYKEIRKHSLIKEVIIISTPSKIFPKELLEIKLNSNLNHEDLLKHVIETKFFISETHFKFPLLLDQLLEDYKEMYNTFLSHPNAQYLENKYFLNEESETKIYGDGYFKDEQKEMYGSGVLFKNIVKLQRYKNITTQSWEALKTRNKSIITYSKFIK